MVFFNYYMFSDFSNVISKQDVKVLAEADDQEVVREVQVYVVLISILYKSDAVFFILQWFYLSCRITLTG